MHPIFIFSMTMVSNSGSWPILTSSHLLLFGFLLFLTMNDQGNRMNVVSAGSNESCVDFGKVKKQKNLTPWVFDRNYRMVGPILIRKHG